MRQLAGAVLAFGLVACLMPSSLASTPAGLRAPRVPANVGPLPTIVRNAIAAGYVAQTNGSFTRVTGNWTLPHVNATQPGWYVNLWIGLGGYRPWSAQNRSADPFAHGTTRIGTFLENNAGGVHRGVVVFFYTVMNGRYNYFAASLEMPGDRIAASIQYVPASGNLVLKIADSGRGGTSVWSMNTTARGARFSSAEWVLSECVEICGATLPYFAPIHFQDARAEVGTQVRSITGWGTPVRLQLLDPGAGTPVDASTSPLWSHGAAFAVVWKSA